MRLTLHVWRQKDASSPGRFVTYEAPDVSPDMSFLEMLDVVNEGLVERGEDPIAFDHDCTTAARASAGSAASSSTAGRTGRVRARRRASCTCGASGTATC
jgi:succinate dehydrogenase / fumarate reductase iron-sulfur subunit